MSYDSDDEPFLDRERELAALEERWASDRSEFLVVWGRRRVGKTALLRRFAQGKRALFLTGDSQREEVLLARFSRLCARALKTPGLGFADWDGFLEFVASAAREERLVLVLDEVGYVNLANPAFYSVLQRHWEEAFRATRLMLVLCGSAVSAMEKEVLGHGSPLYGRRTGQLEVKPMGYAQARVFFPGVKEQRRMEFYALAGGIPAYLNQLDPGLSVKENVQREIFDPTAYLHLEPRLLLLEELREPTTYFALLEAMAGGARRFSEIADKAYLTPSKLPKYLGVLQQLRLVERHHPVTMREKVKRGNSRYRLTDPFFEFWFDCVAPWLGELEGPDWTLPLAELEARWPAHAARSYERVCRQFTAAAALAEVAGLGGPYARVGAWWSRTEEVDVAALGPSAGGWRSLLLGECKWTKEPAGPGVLEGLAAKAPIVEGRYSELRLALFSRAGFTAGCRRAAKALVAEGEVRETGLPLRSVALLTPEEMKTMWEAAGSRGVL